ncbi:uncharacterized protein LOC123708948 [Pieris brassicae]|uniref:Swi5-dependent recombination DNA repair protein 1 homolog n=1 Tax=Pieris brassicae TaxID=7116 RepID=A0A9P0TXL7_PIEBR|nr:uncharacterized protein LOC123708948 [Pieris brassicae]CAH4035359.1 unnamed protein product [Pieris brassicae]
MKSSEDSPKTPGGISKTLLTPCRRLGLSRKFNKKGPSPFISPLSRSQNSTEITNVCKKRKICSTSEESAFLPQSPEKTVLAVHETIACISSPTHISDTPSRNIPVSKKNSKVFLMMQNVDANNKDVITKNTEIVRKSPQNNNKTLSKLSRVNSKKKLKTIPEPEPSNILNEIFKVDGTKANELNVKEPKNLNKECIVLIQKKMLKSLKTHQQDDNNSHKNNVNTSVSQTLFDSDSDDLPLCNLNKNQDSDFVNTMLVKKKTSPKSIPNVNKIKKIKPISEKKTLQKSFDNDDDDFVSTKRTILVKNTYEKVVKPSKAKSTGSITQKDIDELKHRIEMKKKLIIAKAMTEDTEELRKLIKKWQKGCQEALFELFDLMKKKFPDSQNMDYSEILKTLKIPPELVGYDIENDCFITPDDNSIILSSINT